MSCVSRSLAGIANTCTPNKGGIKKVLISNTNPNAIAFQEKIMSFKDVDWHEYNFKKNTGSMTSTLNVDPTTGTNYVTTNLVLQFNHMDTPKRIEISNLALSELYVIVQDSNNKYWFLGFNEPVTATAGTGQTGTAKTDSNNYSITLTDESKTFPYEILESRIPHATPVINLYAGVSLGNAELNPTAARIDGPIKYGNIVTLFSNLSWLQQTWYDKDTGEVLGTKYGAKTEPLSLELNRPSGVYNIALIGR